MLPRDPTTITTLYHGMHKPGSEMCLLEAVAYVAGEEWSDYPKCVSLVLAAFGRAWNDGMRSNKERDQLRQYIPLLIGTRSSLEVELRRAHLALDWLVRANLPAWLRLAKCDELAAKLEGLEVIDPNTTVQTLRMITDIIQKYAEKQYLPQQAGTMPTGVTWATVTRATVTGATATEATWAAVRGMKAVAEAERAKSAARTSRAAARTSNAAARASNAAFWASNAAAWAAWTAWAEMVAGEVEQKSESVVLTLQAEAHQLYHAMIECGTHPNG